SPKRSWRRQRSRSWLRETSRPGQAPRRRRSPDQDTAGERTDGVPSGRAIALRVPPPTQGRHCRGPGSGAAGLATRLGEAPSPLRYRRAYHDARAEGWVVNHRKIQRLWRDEGLRVPQRRRRKRVGSSTVDAPTADAANVVWAVDFQFDADEHGRPIKICSIVDEHTRECIGGLVERSITADRLTA